MLRWLLILWWKMNGWKVQGVFPDHIKKCVIAVGPHTSAWDIIVGMAAREVVPIKKAYFLGKKELFDGPFGWFFRMIGGTPVDRFSSQGMVEQAAAKFSQEEVFRLALSPEGTRKRVEKLRTGFYYIAKTAGVPILPVGMDFKHKALIIGEPLYLSGDEAADMKKIAAFFAPIQGKRPEMGMSHLASVYA